LQLEGTYEKDISKTIETIFSLSFAALVVTGSFIGETTNLRWDKIEGQQTMNLRY